MRTVYILVDPRDSRIHYVGCTMRPKTRLAGHLTEAKTFPDRVKSQWINGLIESGLQPLFIPVQTVPHIMYHFQFLAKYVEYLWIALLRLTGAPLTNTYPLMDVSEFDPKTRADMITSMRYQLRRVTHEHLVRPDGRLYQTYRVIKTKPEYLRIA